MPYGFIVATASSTAGMAVCAPNLKLKSSLSAPKPKPCLSLQNALADRLRRDHEVMYLLVAKGLITLPGGGN